MPLALLLSPDDQAVAAITSVLEEMSVTCDRPLDGASAAQKLNSDRFDLVLVDCENLPAAKLIFDVCRNRKGSGRPVPVAVVDGRAGLPTAFRLGAELILTKPVAKDQARVTIRTALSRVRREESRPDATGQESAAQAVASSKNLTPALEQHADDAADYVAAEGRAFAATAAAGSPSLTSAHDLVPSSMPAPAVKMSAAVAEPDVAEAASTAKGSSFVASNATTSGTSSRLSSAEAKVGEKATTDSKPSAAQGSEDEHKDGEHKTEVIGVKSGSLAASAAPIEQESGTLETKSIETSSEEVAAKVPAKKSAAKTSKSLSRMITLFFLLVACGAFYGAWTYEPGFQSLVKEQVNHLLVLTGMAPKTQAPAPVPVKPTSQAPKPSAAVPLPTNGPDATQSGQSIAPDPNAEPGAPAAPSASTNATSPASGQQAAPANAPAPTAPANPAAPTPAATTPAGASTNPQSAVPHTKPGVTRIDLSPNAVEHPASSSGGKSSAPASKTPPQH
ncbi:MAG: hypothetical protein WB817_18385 [Terriglobales bacterium]